jgi:N-acetylglutamate synthase-like GNAT family acetyltransferase
MWEMSHAAPQVAMSRKPLFSYLAIRRARRADQPHIRDLVLSERLAPDKLHWRNFVVAVANGRIVGTVQMRPLPDGHCELGSLAVAPDMRGRGIAARLIETLLADADGPVQMITTANFAAHYERFGFRQIEATKAPRAVSWRYMFGQFFGAVVSLLKGYPPRRLAILQRMG